MKKNIKEKVKGMLTAKGLRLLDMAATLNVSRQHLDDLLKGDNKLTVFWLEKMAEYLNCSPGELLISATSDLNKGLTLAKSGVYPISNKTVQVVGYVGPGQFVCLYDERQEGLIMKTVACPPGLDPDYIIAIEVQGDSMLPKYDPGEIIYYNKPFGIDLTCLNKVCVIGLKDGQTIIKRLRASIKKNHYNLESYNSSAVDGVEISWCAPILFTKPL